LLLLTPWQVGLAFRLRLSDLHLAAWRRIAKISLYLAQLSFEQNIPTVDGEVAERRGVFREVRVHDPMDYILTGEVRCQSIPFPI
jgi:hypothetical protein